jgi:hypothetical protein
MNNEKYSYMEAEDLANKVLEIYNIEDILALSNADEGKILAFLIYWEQVEIPDDVVI